MTGGGNGKEVGMGRRRGWGGGGDGEEVGMGRRWDGERWDGEKVEIGRRWDGEEVGWGGGGGGEGVLKLVGMRRWVYGSWRCDEEEEMRTWG